VPSTINWDDINFEKPFWKMNAYSHSKLANVLFTNELARRLKGLILPIERLSTSLYLFQIQISQRTVSTLVNRIL
jgi:hypothetical protein